jgi:aminopeptidase YwaD
MRRALLKSLIVLSLLTLNNYSQQSSEFQKFVNRFCLNTATNHLLKLTGEKKVWFEGDSVFIKSRNAFRKGNDIAEQYIFDVLSNFGYTPEKQNPFDDCVNIIAKKAGSKFTDKYILIGAHYDSMPDYGKSPGADDNASGVVCILEAARLFADLETEYSIIFALWDEEERPSPMGSEYFVNDALESEMDILEVINIDMIAYDSNDDGDVVVNRSNFDSDFEIDNLLNKINEELDLQLDIHYRKTYTRSDDRAFAREGFNTIGFIEKYYNSSNHPKNDFNPDWHTSFDTLENFNWSYYERNCKLILASLYLLSTYN